MKTILSALVAVSVLASAAAPASAAWSQKEIQQFFNETVNR